MPNKSGGAGMVVMGGAEKEERKKLMTNSLYAQEYDADKCHEVMMRMMIVRLTYG